VASGFTFAFRRRQLLLLLLLGGRSAPYLSILGAPVLKPDVINSINIILQCESKISTYIYDKL